MYMHETWYNTHRLTPKSALGDAVGGRLARLNSHKYTMNIRKRNILLNCSLIDLTKPYLQKDTTDNPL